MGLNEFLFFIGFLAFIFGMLVLDLGVLSKKSHVVSFREAAAWSVVWIIVALGFFVILRFYGEQMHGINDYNKLKEVVELYVDDKDELVLSPNDFEKSVASYRQNLSIEYLTGWLLEYSLSIDNIFVIIMIFGSFGVKEKYFKKVLLWGILGAVVMRFIFIFVGSELIHRFHWILWIFGGLLIFSGIRMFMEKEDEKIEPDKHPVVKFVSRYFRVFPRYFKDYFFIRRKGVIFVTPLFVVVLIVEFTDLLFAVDSVPAVFAVTQDPYIVFFSNIFAIMGLRSMFFFLSNIMHLFHYLKTGLAFLLTFIGIKMIIPHEYLKLIGYKTHYSLYIILAILIISVLASVVFPAKHKEEVVNA
jgi:tellurite resistance protein TerC